MQEIKKKASAPLMQKRTAVNDTGTVFFQRLVMRASTVALMLFKTIERVPQSEFRHESITLHLRCNRSKRDDRNEFVAVNDGFLRVFRRRAKRAVELYTH